ncbi:MAG: class I SAM-dependent rRNA methyltransferase, partial [Limisphaerales bacterium]
MTEIAMSPDAGSKRRPVALRLRLTAAAERVVRSGHPWVFAESVTEQTRMGRTGELAILYDRRDKFLAFGLFDPDSPLRVRVLHAGKPQTLDGGWWARRLDQALEKRRGLFDEQTNGLRWIHGESDGLPGLVLDQYNKTLVVKLYTPAWFPWLDACLALFRQKLLPERIVLRLSRNIQTQAAARFGKVDGQVLWGPPLGGAVVFCESGLRFEADVFKGQKTGFFLDQRENRRRVGTLAQGRHVLNAFSFSGGFSLYSARGGARSVTDVDISPRALAAAGRNFELNRDIKAVSQCRHEMIQADVFDWLEQAVKGGRGLQDRTCDRGEARARHQPASATRLRREFDLIIL